MDIMKNRIKEIRKSKGISQESLGDMIGMKKAGVSKLERGSVKLTTAHIDKIAQALGCDPIEIMGKTAYSQETRPLSRGLSEAPRTVQSSKIPVWGTVDAQGGERYAINTEDTPIDFIEPLPVQETDKDAFGLLVAGESMFPKYEPGNIVCVHTRKPAIKGRDCVVEMNDGSGLIKKYLGMQGDSYLLEQLNPPKQIILKKADITRIMPVVGVIYEK
jgi:phage repressor protein C with HTH and peptisase S24 domain